MNRNFDTAASLILKLEGSYSNDPNDSGGATNMGITIGILQRLGLDITGDAVINDADVRAVTPEIAKKIFKEEYWDLVNADELPDGLDFMAADTAYNMGPGTAKKLLDTGAGLERFTLYRIARYLELAERYPKNRGFFRGWVSRTMQVYEVANNMRGE